MKIAVIGGNGFIGKEFVNYATERGHEIVVIGSDYDAFSEEGAKQIKSILAGSEAMVFLAAKRPISEFSMTEYLYNIRLASVYFEFAREAGISNVAAASSRSVYSSENIPWKEADLDCPLSLYGAAKQAVDTLALHYNDAYGMSIKCLRLAQVIGAGEKKGFLLNTLIDNAAVGKKQTIYGQGVGKRQYIYVKDVCDAILHSISEKAELGGIYNIGMEGNVSIVELAETVNEVFGNGAGIEMLTDKPEDKKHYLMSILKARDELGWSAKYDIKATFEDMKK